ncbi:MAG TPA: VOC family protein [Thermoleophilaceae bacterium]|jgi:hypothetical protein
MLERDGYIPGVPCWADTTQPDPEAALDFYGGLFGWEFEDVMPEDAPLRYHVARIRAGDVAAVGAQRESVPPAAVWNTYIWVDSADETSAKVRDAGGSVLADPYDVIDAGRMAVLADPEGAAFCVWEARRHKGAKIVNEAGSVNFNDLHTRDMEGARRFYGEVFGWGTLDLGGPGAAWTLPGYGDHLEESRPGLREGMAQMGAPAGFEDVVATLNPLSGDQPHWAITFATEDADATAEKAAELGGKVISPPQDGPWVRATVIADPQGATFTANQFVPENKDLSSQAGAAAGGS